MRAKSYRDGVSSRRNIVIRTQSLGVIESTSDSSIERLVKLNKQMKEQIFLIIEELGGKI